MLINIYLQILEGETLLNVRILGGRYRLIKIFF